MLKYTGTIVTSSFEEGDRSERSRQAPPQWRFLSSLQDAFGSVELENKLVCSRYDRGDGCNTLVQRQYRSCTLSKDELQLNGFSLYDCVDDL